jgi:RNA polymerase sigma-70 factor (ECF subfamily)
MMESSGDMKESSEAEHQVHDGAPESGSSGERIGVDALFRAHAPFVAGFLHRLGVPPGDVDDLVQEVFLIAHRKGGYVPGAGKPRTWLGAIALRVARSGHRSRNRRRESPDEPNWASFESQAKDPAEQLELRKSLERVQRALDTLDIDHRAAFMLYEIEGESCESIAAAFEVPVGTVYSRLHHARKRFLDAYGAHDASAPRVGRPRLVGGT